MCGFTGFIERASRSYPLATTGERMALAILHRGPDDAGVWTDAEAGICLAHRRLSILDLSPHGHQPMASTCGRYVIVFNGEIYNHHQIRRDLEQQHGPQSWRGHSDTEVMLAAIAHWGLQKALEAFNGMFAFALWDRQDRVLHLARDRAGEKPLYYGWAGSAFLFGSELKALRAHPAWNAPVDRTALALYLKYNYVPAPLSIHQGIFKLKPGCYLSLPLDSAPGQLPEAQEYWSAIAAAQYGLANPFEASDAELAAELETLLKDAVALRMEADVPLGAFLSGGIDSSTVVALMQAQSRRPVQTFTIGFNEEGYNEAVHAKAVARHLGTDHTELYVTPEEALDVIPRLPHMYDEPFADSSQIPTYLVSALARKHVTVSLSGDAGDELFCGYNRYFQGRRIWDKLDRVPHGGRKGIASLLESLTPATWDSLGRIVPQRLRPPALGDKLHKLARVIRTDSPDVMYDGLISQWSLDAAVVKGADYDRALGLSQLDPSLLPDFTARMMLNDQLAYLADDILVKVDRASMAVSLESRVPFLDHRVIEHAWRIPLAAKIRDGKGKAVLRNVLYNYVPRDLIERPKMGFGVPIDQWLRGPLRDWCEDLLSARKLTDGGYFEAAPIRQKWQEHLSGTRNWSYHLWTILMFQAWLERQVEDETSLPAAIAVSAS
ncbi:asparagine synthase (glutamine-hydrolyzing) [Govanella unica]|uniref:asparagine synthase (glutamine-hydrolyzing) n=1 Tax=Govanella unica TaxID=2975056 RepID=A0A9X3Z600_9PROT|nr:asparagine synthase (glutamine-hydrolyzing) [Govania unica]MDA5192498.1 asparagine synthase (glutamine-hydrolyzing) [Govania unica]